MLCKFEASNLKQYCYLAEILLILMQGDDAVDHFWDGPHTPVISKNFPVFYFILFGFEVNKIENFIGDGIEI